MHLSPARARARDAPRRTSSPGPCRTATRTRSAPPVGPAAISCSSVARAPERCSASRACRYGSVNRGSSTRSPNSERSRRNASGSSPWRRGGRHERLARAVDDLDRLALLVDALGVARPAGDDGRRQAAPSRRRRGCRGRRAAATWGCGRSSRRTAGRPCPGPGRWRSARSARGGRRSRSIPGTGVERRESPRAPCRPAGSGEQRVLRRRRARAGSRPGGRSSTSRLVAGVEQPQLHQLVGLDVVDELDAGVLPAAAGRAEGVLEHPLRERLAHDRPAVGRRRSAASTSARSASVVTGVIRSTIESGKLHLAARSTRPSSGSRSAAKATKLRRATCAVALDVVAGHDGERRRRRARGAGRGPRRRARSWSRRAARRSRSCTTSGASASNSPVTASML